MWTAKVENKQTKVFYGEKLVTYLYATEDEIKQIELLSSLPVDFYDPGCLKELIGKDIKYITKKGKITNISYSEKSGFIINTTLKIKQVKNCPFRIIDPKIFKEVQRLLVK